MNGTLFLEYDSEPLPAWPDPLSKRLASALREFRRACRRARR